MNSSKDLLPGSRAIGPEVQDDPLETFSNLQQKKAPQIAGPLNKSTSIDYLKVAGQGLPALDFTATIMKSP